MKTKILFLLSAGGLLALAAWLVHVPTSAQADEIPEKYRETVRKGLEYLVKSQHKDGHWEGDDGEHPVAMTGLAGIALLMEWQSERETYDRSPHRPKYATQISKAADWLMNKSQPKRDGLIFSEHASETSRYMQGHGLATLFLAGALKHEHDDARNKKLNDALTRAVKYIVKSQSSEGGWYNTSKLEGHDFATIAATVIQIQALQAAENAGIPVPSEAINDGQEYLKTALAKDEEKAKPGKAGSRPADTAAALACRYTAIQEMKPAVREKLFKDLQAEIPMGRDIRFGGNELTHYHYAQAVFHLGGDSWKSYRTTMFDHLQSVQNKDGSWRGDGIGVGPVYATAIACTILQLDKKSHPSRPSPFERRRIL
jgi:hypothetical protein